MLDYLKNTHGFCLNKKDFENRYKNLKDKLIVCNNLIDYNKIIKKSEEVITDFKKDLFYFDRIHLKNGDYIL